MYKFGQESIIYLLQVIYILVLIFDVLGKQITQMTALVSSLASLLYLPIKPKSSLSNPPRRSDRWVLPKGGWESDEATAEDAAQREAWEEAGISGRITKQLGKILDSRGKKGPATYLFFEMDVVEEGMEWPEMAKRRRKWVTYKDAVEKFAARPELKDALDKSSITKA